MACGDVIPRAAVAVADPSPPSAAARWARRPKGGTSLAPRSAGPPRPGLRLTAPSAAGSRPGPIALPGGLLAATIGDPPGDGVARWEVAWTLAARVRRVHLLRVGEAPDTLPLGLGDASDGSEAAGAKLGRAAPGWGKRRGWPLDPEVVARLQAWVAELRSRGLRADREVADTRRGERTIVERAAAIGARTVLLGRVRTPRGGLDRRASCVLRRLAGIEVVLFSE